jgi:hypothetical protein
VTDQTACLDERVQAAVRDALAVVAQNPAAGPDVAASFVASAVLAEVHRQPTDRAPAADRDAELEQLRTENARMRHELEVMYGGAFDSLKPPPADRADEPGESR